MVLGGRHWRELVFVDGNEEQYKFFIGFLGFVPVLVPNREKTNSRKNKFWLGLRKIRVMKCGTIGKNILG
jgi:hypothetical protein